MNTTNKLWQIVAAVGLALLAVILTGFYVSNYKHHVQSSESQVSVLVAAKDIPADTPGSELTHGGWLQTESVPRRDVVPGAISSADQLRTLVATEPTYAGEQVTARRFGTPQERGVRAQITGTLRAGDHVDVVGSWETQNASPTAVVNGDDRVTRVFLRDLLVLSAPTAANKSGGVGTSSNPSVQLRLTDAQSQRFDWIIANGKDWRLEIRPQTNAA